MIHGKFKAYFFKKIHHVAHVAFSQAGSCFVQRVSCIVTGFIFKKFKKEGFFTCVSQQRVILGLADLSGSEAI